MIEIHPIELAAVLALVALTACGAPPDREPPAGGELQAAPPVEGGSPASESGDEAPSPATSAPDEGVLGPALKNPESYYGLYSSDEQPDRTWFVAEAKRPPYADRAPEVPPGHLAVGAMFGDVAPWHMRTLSETEFEQARVPSQQSTPVRVRFELDDVGRAVAMTFTSDGLADQGRLLRRKDLPEDWQ